MSCRFTNEEIRSLTSVFDSQHVALSSIRKRSSSQIVSTFQALRITPAGCANPTYLIKIHETGFAVGKIPPGQRPIQRLLPESFPFNALMGQTRRGFLLGLGPTHDSPASLAELVAKEHETPSKSLVHSMLTAGCFGLEWLLKLDAAVRPKARVLKDCPVLQTLVVANVALSSAETNLPDIVDPVDDYSVVLVRRISRLKPPPCGVHIDVDLQVRCIADVDDDDDAGESVDGSANIHTTIAVRIVPCDGDLTETQVARAVSTAAALRAVDGFENDVFTTSASAFPKLVMDAVLSMDRARGIHRAVDFAAAISQFDTDFKALIGTSGHSGPR